MEFGAAFPADGESFEVVEKGEGLLNDVSELAQALDVRRSLAGDDGQDPAVTQLVTVGVGVVALSPRRTSRRRRAGRGGPRQVGRRRPRRGSG